MGGCELEQRLAGRVADHDPHLTFGEGRENFEQDILTDEPPVLDLVHRDRNGDVGHVRGFSLEPERDRIKQLVTFVYQSVLPTPGSLAPVLKSAGLWLLNPTNSLCVLRRGDS